MRHRLQLCMKLSAVNFIQGKGCIVFHLCRMESSAQKSTKCLGKFEISWISWNGKKWTDCERYFTLKLTSTMVGWKKNLWCIRFKICDCLVRCLLLLVELELLLRMYFYVIVVHVFQSQESSNFSVILYHQAGKWKKVPIWTRLPTILITTILTPSKRRIWQTW